MTRERIKAGLVILVALALFVAAAAWPPARAAGEIQVRTATATYQLDSGEFVRWWIDEPRGLLCTLFESFEGGIGLSCVPLDLTVYNWPVTQ